MLGEVANSRLATLIPLALVAAGIACGSTPGAASSSPPTVLIPAVDGAPAPTPAPLPTVAPIPSSPRAAGIAWNTSERDAREQARREDVPLLVYVRADWASACLEMERSAWRDPRVAAAAGRFVALRLDVTEAEGDAELYAQRYGVDRIPQILLVDPSGRTLATSGGVASADALLAFLRGPASE